MVQAKQGNIDTEFFKNIINYEKIGGGGVGCSMGATYILGWIFKFLYRKEQAINKKDLLKEPNEQIFSFHLIQNKARK